MSRLPLAPCLADGERGRHDDRARMDHVLADVLVVEREREAPVGVRGDRARNACALTYERRLAYAAADLPRKLRVQASDPCLGATDRRSEAVEHGDLRGRNHLGGEVTKSGLGGVGGKGSGHPIHGVVSLC
jgi:hypothetical protein